MLIFKEVEVENVFIPTHVKAFLNTISIDFIKNISKNYEDSFLINKDNSLNKTTSDLIEDLELSIRGIGFDSGLYGRVRYSKSEILTIGIKQLGNYTLLIIEDSETNLENKCLSITKVNSDKDIINKILKFVKLKTKQ